MAPIASLKYYRLPPRWLFVKIVDSEGRTGWGEASLEGHSEAIEGCLDNFRGRIIGRNADEIERIWQDLYRGGFYRGGPVLMSALAGIDIALWDLKGKKLGVPIYDLLGGKVREKVRVYAWIGGDRPEDVEAQALARKAQGFTAIKMNATADVGWLESPAALDSAVTRLETVKATGLDAAIDFHGRLHKAMAVQLAARLSVHRPLFIEEPLLSQFPAAVKALSDHVPTPIALGERLYSRWDVVPYLENGAVSILQPDVSHVGGISEMRRIATMAEAYDVVLAPHCPIGPITLAASVQVDATTANFGVQEMSLGIHYNTEDESRADITSYIRNPEVWEVREGYIEIPPGPGLGIEIDEDWVERVASEYSKSWKSPTFHGPDGELREW